MSSSGGLDWIAVISQVGFPIAVAVYLLYERTTTFKETREEMSKLATTVLDVVKANTMAFTELKTVIDKMCEKLNQIANH